MTPDDEIRQELERVAQSEPRSGREAMAKVTALRTLERMNRPKDQGVADEQIKRLFDETRNPEERVREDDWYPARPVDCDDESWKTLRELDLVDTVADRRRHYLNLKREGLVV